MRIRTAAIVVAAVPLALAVIACSGEDTASVSDGDASADARPSGLTNDLDAATDDGGDGGGAVVDAGPYATKVVSFSPGQCAGFGADRLPNIVLGPPMGRGHGSGSTDVLSLGTGGEIVLSFEPNVIADGPGVDFIVFENAFFATGSDKPFAEIAEVSVSEDGQTWKTFPCTATAYPWGACAGWHEVPKEASLDPAKAGGDPYDLADIGATRARFVRIVDKGGQACDPAANPKTNGFDLDAVGVVHVE